MQAISPIDRMTAEMVEDYRIIKAAGLIIQGMAQELGSISTEVNEKIF